MPTRTLTAELIVSAHAPQAFPRDDRPQVAVVGRSNVGKSSLLNCVLGLRKLARVSSTPGRTQAINFFLVEQRFYVVDLPGYGWARVARTQRQVWARLIDHYLRQERSPALVILLVDGKVGATTLDVEARGYLAELELPVQVVATKIDRLKQGSRHRQLTAIRQALSLPPEGDLIPFSALTGEGRDVLWRTIEQAIEVRVQRASSLR
jgi:GTP-binding protein